MIRKLAAYALRLTAERLDPEPTHTVFVVGDTYGSHEPGERAAHFKRMAKRAMESN